MLQYCNRFQYWNLGYKTTYSFTPGWLIIKLTCFYLLNACPLLDKSPVLAPYIQPSYPHTHGPVPFGVLRSCSVCVWNLVWVLKSSMQQQASSVPSPPPEDYCCWKNLFVPAGLECLSSSTSLGNTEPKVNGTTEQWNTSGIPHSQSPTGLLKVDVTSDTYSHYCIPGVLILITLWRLNGKSAKAGSGGWSTGNWADFVSIFVMECKEIQTTNKVSEGML